MKVESQARKNEVSVRIQIVLICLFFEIHIKAENPNRMNAGSPAKDTPLLEAGTSTVLGYHVLYRIHSLGMDDINIEARRVGIMGEIRYLFRKPSSNEPMVSETELELVKEKGIVGDKSFGSRKRQVLIVDEEILLKYSLIPGDLRENIVSADLRISELTDKSVIQIGDAVLKITGDCAPCAYIYDIQEGLQDEIRGNRGVLAVVQQGSVINVGDPIRVLDSGE
jgi:hypothetical protein